MPPVFPIVGWFCCTLSGFPFLSEWRPKFLMRTVRLSMCWLLTASPASPHTSCVLFLPHCLFSSCCTVYLSSKEPAFHGPGTCHSSLCPLNHFSPTSLPVNFCSFIRIQCRFCFLREFYLNLLDWSGFSVILYCSI